MMSVIPRIGVEQKIAVERIVAISIRKVRTVEGIVERIIKWIVERVINSVTTIGDVPMAALVLTPVPLTPADLMIGTINMGGQCEVVIKIGLHKGFLRRYQLALRDLDKHRFGNDSLNDGRCNAVGAIIAREENIALRRLGGASPCNKKCWDEDDSM